MRHRDFGAARPLPGGVDRDETMHLAIEPHVFDYLAAVRLQRAAVIVQPNMQQLGDKPIGSLRWKAPCYQLILALDSPAGDDIVSLFDFFDQSRDIRGIILAIR